MNVLAIDTHEVVKELKAVGFSEDQAEAVTRAVRRAQNVDLSALVTKADLDGSRRETEAASEIMRKESAAGFDAVRKETKAEFDAVRKEIELGFDVLRQEVKAGLSETKSDLSKWIVGTIGLQTVTILGAVLALTHVPKP